MKVHAGLLAIVVLGSFWVLDGSMLPLPLLTVTVMLGVDFTLVFSWLRCLSCVGRKG